MLIGLTALKLEAAALADALVLPQGATVVASQIGAGAGHGLPAAGGTMQATVVEYAHRAYTAAFQDIFGVLAVLSILTAVVCIVTLRQPMLDPAPEAACAESARGNGAVWRPGGARTTVAEGHTPPLSWNMLAYCCCMGCLGPTAGGSAALNGRSCSRDRRIEMQTSRLPNRPHPEACQDQPAGLESRLGAAR